MQYVEGQLAPVTLLCQPATHCIIATTGLVISRFQNTAGASIYSTENLVVPRRVDLKAGKRCPEQKKRCTERQVFYHACQVVHRGLLQTSYVQLEELIQLYSVPSLEQFVL